MAQTLQTLSVISFAVAGVCLALAIFFGFLFKIPGVIGDLSGRTARKSIAKLRAANEKNAVADIIQIPDVGTTALLADENATAPLAAAVHQPGQSTEAKRLVMIEEVMLIHTDEEIG